MQYSQTPKLEAEGDAHTALHCKLIASEDDDFASLLAHRERGSLHPLKPSSGICTPTARRAVDALPAVRASNDHVLGTLEPRAVAAPQAGVAAFGLERQGLRRPTGRRERGEGRECGEALADRWDTLRQLSEMLGPEARVATWGRPGGLRVQRRHVELGEPCLPRAEHPSSVFRHRARETARARGGTGVCASAPPTALSDTRSFIESVTPPPPPRPPELAPSQSTPIYPVLRIYSSHLPSAYRPSPRYNPPFPSIRHRAIAAHAPTAYRGLRRA